MWTALFSKTPRVRSPQRPSLTLFFCLAGAFILTLVPHVQQLPLWVSASVLAAMLLRSVSEAFRWPLPSSTFCGVIALCLLVGIYLQFHTVFGRDAGTAFMAGLLTIKFFEIRGPRDVSLIIFSSFFVVMSSLLYSQAFELFIYCLIMMWVLTSLLVRTQMGDQPEDGLVRLLGMAALVFFQALPVTLFLFFFFPRFHGTLQIGMDDSSVGLTDTVKPGSISRLSSDDSTAMTVKFGNAHVPAPDAMYWRAIVLWNYQDGTWTPGDAALLPKESPPLAASDSYIDQEITIRAHFHKWLFALDYPVTKAWFRPGSANSSEFINGGVLQLSGFDPHLNQRERYNVESAAILAPEQLSPELERLALELPNQKNDSIDPKVRALAKQLKQGSKNEDDYIAAVLHYFRHNGFLYTDSPGPGGKNALADFLFKRRRGFCEHYASAFAVLMRLGGFPARLVVGYQGAQFNPYDNLYIVKQSNAHSWDEVWIYGEKRWRRVDPTAIISNHDNLTTSRSNHVSTAGDAELSLEVAHHRLTFLSDAQLPDWVREGLLEMELRRQQMEASWDDWVFSYDPQAQSRLAEFLGFGREARDILALACFLALTICAVVLGRVMMRRQPVPAVEKFYARFCRDMAQRGVPRETWEGPLAYTERVAAAFPEKRPILEETGRVVAQARYSAAPTAPTRKELDALLRLITASHAASSSGDRT